MLRPNGSHMDLRIYVTCHYSSLDRGAYNETVNRGCAARKLPVPFNLGNGQFAGKKRNKKGETSQFIIAQLQVVNIP